MQTKKMSFMPIVGMNNVAEDAALKVDGDAPRLYARDLINLQVSETGRITLRPSPRQVTATEYKNLWQSSLHKDVFGTLGKDWVKIDPGTWTHEVLAEIGEGPAYHEVLNNQVCVAGPLGLFTYNGQAAQRLTLSTPPKPLALAGTGSLHPGTYGVAIAWLRGQQESGTSDIAFVDVPDQGGISVTLPPVVDPEATGIRLYVTRQNGTELLRQGDYPTNAGTLSLPLLGELGAPAQFDGLDPMPTGKYLKYWRGRLLTATRNLLHFSEALAYHLHDQRFGFVQLPQRVTFVQPVDGGIWLGQVDHVLFLEGSGPDGLVWHRKSSRAPVPGSAMTVPADVLDGELAQGGATVAIWLAENGYVVGTASGQIIEIHSGMIKGISAESGNSVVVDRRLLTAVV